MSRIWFIYNVTIVWQELLQNGILMAISGEWCVLSSLVNTQRKEAQHVINDLLKVMKTRVGWHRCIFSTYCAASGLDHKFHVYYDWAQTTAIAFTSSISCWSPTYSVRQEHLPWSPVISILPVECSFFGLYHSRTSRKVTPETSLSLFKFFLHLASGTPCFLLLCGKLLFLPLQNTWWCFPGAKAEVLSGSLLSSSLLSVA